MEHPQAPLLLQQRPTQSARGCVRGGIIVMLTAAPIVLMVLRGVASVAVVGDAGMAAEFKWSNTQQGQFLSSFFTGYISSQVIGGWLAAPERVGAKKVMLACVLLSAVASVATPFATKGGLQAAVAARVVEGIAQGPLFPTMWGLVGAWLPQQEISAGSCLCNSGFGMGSMVAFFAAPSVMSWLGWRALFWAPSIPGVVWCVAWFLVGTDSPRQHPSISAEERLYIAGDSGPAIARSVQALEPSSSPATLTGAGDDGGWRQMIRSPALWGQIFADFAANWFFYVVFTFLPQYLSVALGFSTDDASWLTGANILVGIVSTNLAGVLVRTLLSHRSALRSVCLLSLCCRSSAWTRPGSLDIAVRVAGRLGDPTICWAAAIGTKHLRYRGQPRANCLPSSHHLPGGAIKHAHSRPDHDHPFLRWHQRGGIVLRDFGHFSSISRFLYWRRQHNRPKHWHLCSTADWDTA